MLLVSKKKLWGNHAFSEIIKLQFGRNAIHCIVFYCFYKNCCLIISKKNAWFTPIFILDFYSPIAHSCFLESTPYLKTFRPKWVKSIPYFKPKRLQNHTLWGGTYLYSLYSSLPGRRNRGRGWAEGRGARESPLIFSHLPRSPSPCPDYAGHAGYLHVYSGVSSGNCGIHV